MTPEVLTGTCKWWHPTKGYGFIVRADQTGDVFVHFRQLKDADALKVGQRVAFVLGRSNDGKPRAERCEVLPACYRLPANLDCFDFKLLQPLLRRLHGWLWLVLDHPGVLRSLKLRPLVHLVEELQERFVHGERMLDGFLLSVDLGRHG